jgi:hypothetical protein
MLGTVPTETREAEVLARIEQVVEGIKYVSPELRDERRKEIISSVRLILREWRNQ